MALPEIFRLADMVRVLGISPGMARLSAHRWKARELIRPIGPRLGLYINLVRCPQPDGLLPQAVAMAFPSAVIMGPTVLHQQGWTTQIPQQLHVAIPYQRTVPVVDGVVIHRKPRTWYQRYRPADNGVSLYGVPALSPAQAWDDMAASGDDAILTEDDLDEFSVEDWMDENEDNEALMMGVERKPFQKKTRMKMIR